MNAVANSNNVNVDEISQKTIQFLDAQLAPNQDE